MPSHALQQQQAEERRDREAERLDIGRGVEPVLRHMEQQQRQHDHEHDQQKRAEYRMRSAGREKASKPDHRRTFSSPLIVF